MEDKCSTPPHEKIKLTEVNPHLTCHLCKGYYIDATTIVECLHSFCRSCIIKFLQLNSYCPICEVMINKAKPNIKPDKTLQDIVYKLVPGLYAMEMTRRRQFYRDRPDEAALVSPEQRGACTERIIFSPQDAISLSIEYTTDDQPEWYKNREATSEVPLRRYLQCPAMLRVEHLKKFICNKYNVDIQQFHVDILYKRVPLPDHYTLMDIAYIYSWKRNEPMKFFFRITDINLVTERFDYFEPSLSNAEEDFKLHPTHRSTPAKPHKQTHKKETEKEIIKIKTEKQIKVEENSSDNVLVKNSDNDNQNSAKIDCTEQKVKIKQEKIDSDVSNSDSQKTSEKVPITNFKNCIPEVKTPPTKELTIKTNNFTNILGCDPKTNSTLKSLQENCQVPTLLKAVSSQKSPSKSKTKSPMKTDKTQKSLTETLPQSTKREELPQTVNHIPMSFENIFKPIKTDTKKSGTKESFSKTLKSIHETIKNFPRSDTPDPMFEENSSKPAESPKTNLLKPLSPIITIPIPKKGETTNAAQKSPRAHHHSPRSPKGPSKPEVLQKLNEQLKMTENLLTIVRNASKASEAKSEAKALANGLISPKEHKKRDRTQSPVPEIKVKQPTSPEDCGKHKFLESIQLTPKDSLSPIKANSLTKTKELANKLEVAKKIYPTSPKKITAPAEIKKWTETIKKSPPKMVKGDLQKEQGVKRKLPRKEKPVKRIKLSPPKICPKLSKVQKILPKPTTQTNLTQSFSNVVSKMPQQNGVAGVLVPQSSGLVQILPHGNTIAPQVNMKSVSTPNVGMILSNNSTLGSGVASQNVPKPIVPKVQALGQSQEVKNSPKQLQSLFTNCNINIPSSLSITLTESPRSDDGYESKPNPIKPVQNYIEIVKLPDTTSPVPKNEKSNDSSSSKEIKVEIKQETGDAANKKLTFQTMFEEAIKKTDGKSTETPPQVKVEPKKEAITSNSTQPKTNPTLNLAKTSPKSENSKRNILEIAHQLSKKSKLDLEHTISKTTIPKTEKVDSKINIVNSFTNSGGSMSIQNTKQNNASKTLPQKLPIPRLPIQKAPTPKLGSTNARAVPKPKPTNPKVPLSSTPITPKSPINQQIENIPNQPSINNSLSPNQILEKYNIQNLQQLSTNLTQAQLAFQQALLMSHQIEMQRLQASQKLWLANPNVLAHYENYVQSLKQNQQNQICGNTNKN